MLNDKIESAEEKIDSEELKAELEGLTEVERLYEAQKTRPLDPILQVNRILKFINLVDKKIKNHELHIKYLERAKEIMISDLVEIEDEYNIVT